MLSAVLKWGLSEIRRIRHVKCPICNAQSPGLGSFRCCATRSFTTETQSTQRMTCNRFGTMHLCASPCSRCLRGAFLLRPDWVCLSFHARVSSNLQWAIPNPQSRPPCAKRGKTSPRSAQIGFVCYSAYLSHRIANLQSPISNWVGLGNEPGADYIDCDLCLANHDLLFFTSIAAITSWFYKYQTSPRSSREKGAITVTLSRIVGITCYTRVA